VVISSNTPIRISDEVQTALREGRGIVALETTIVVHGLPRPMNLEVAKACEDAVRSQGSIPATIGVLDGKAVVGLSGVEVERLADPSRPAIKLSARDVGLAVSQDLDGATTVAGTIALAHVAGISVMATGGLGGVHRAANETFDESADLTCLARTPVLVVASGVKSILDIPATLERLDTLGVPVVGYRTSSFPGFYLHESGEPVPWRCDDAISVALGFRAHREFSSTGMLLANPIGIDKQLDPELHERALAHAFSVVATDGITGRDVTPALLKAFSEFTSGASVIVNRDLVVANALLAGEVAAALAASQ
jgi:pseudouridine-5'-phosphate glycosidase